VSSMKQGEQRSPHFKSNLGIPNHTWSEFSVACLLNARLGTNETDNDGGIFASGRFERFRSVQYP
jgi:hypothetical protein